MRGVMDVFSLHWGESGKMKGLRENKEKVV
jgi:hypothetical protein